jgi:hypothetical protein
VISLSQNAFFQGWNNEFVQDCINTKCLKIITVAEAAIRLSVTIAGWAEKRRQRRICLFFRTSSS